jgi:hypothetical protein
MNQSFRRLATFAVFSLCGSLATLLAVRARAAGIPDAAALTYTGYLENPDGTPVSGNKSIGLSVYDAETDGNEVCALKPADVEPVVGRFQLALPEKCTTAVKANPDLWVEVMVEGALLGRTKLGAVPYAIEAAHATDADEAVHAAAADAAGTADALTAKALLGVPVTKDVAASDEVTQVITFPAYNGIYLLTATLSGAASSINTTYVVHTPRTALNVHAQPLLADTYGEGKIEAKTQNGGVPWSFNAAGGLTLNLVFTNGTAAATATYTLVRLQ